MKRKVLLIAAIVALAGCAQKPIVLEKYGQQAGEFESDMRACEYDAVLHGSTPDPTMRTSIGAGIEMAMRRRDIQMACMKSKGWHPSEN